MNKSILSRSFSTREKALILTLVVVLLVAAYYFLVVRNVAETRAANATAIEDVQTQIEVQKILAQGREKMQHELDELGTLANLPEVAVYDNLRNELDELNGILRFTTSYDLKFSTPELDGTTIRRPVNITFSVPTYAEALGIVDRLQNGAYRCDVTNFSFDATMTADGTVTNVNAVLEVTYFESPTGAESLNGLVEKKTQ
ncbi:hypothetical protein [Raoultibacter phocaeensis]|uniref:hypothetical protein n=1 Tax=Raoultibacter phocaeensis TaxID=2479841 RepID=UPI00111B4F25|nr:hypothetical protein [Raoultibacter phocaeensis]